MNDQPFRDSVIEEAAGLVANRTTLRLDTRAGEDYRRDILRTLVVRVFELGMRGMK